MKRKNTKYSESMATYIKIWMLLLLTPLLWVSCIDDNEYSEQGMREQVELRLSFNVDSDLRSATDDDTHVSHLRMIAFEMEGTNVKNVINRVVYEHATMTGKDTEFHLTLNPKRYIMYFVANEEKAISPIFSQELSTVTTENELQQILLSYYESDKGVSPLPPLVMTQKYDIDFSSPSVVDASELTENGGIKSISSTLIEMDVLLKYTCVKVSYTIVFDKNDEEIIDQDLKDNGLTLESIQFKNLAKKSNLFVPTSYTSEEDPFFEGEVVSATSPNLELTTTGWKYSGVAYIPECLYSVNDFVSYMELNAKVPGSKIASAYKIELIGEKGDTSKKITPRGTEYIINGKIVSLGERDGIVATIKVKEWTPQEVHVSVGEYELWVSKTHLGPLTSTNQLSFSYITNAPRIEIKPASDFEDIFTVSRSDESTVTQGTVIVESGKNAGVDVEGVGIVLVTLFDELGNPILTKEIKVDYNYKPFLTVTPKVLTIDWGLIHADNGSLNSTLRHINYKTNVQDIRLSNSFVYEPNGEEISDIQAITLDKENNRINVKANYLYDNETKIVDKTYKIIFSLVSDQYPHLNQEVTVIIKPDNRDRLRINFRVINDPKTGSDVSDLKRWKRCYIDIYNGNGASAIRFSQGASWPGTEMQYNDGAGEDGWFYFDLDLTKDWNKQVKSGSSYVMFTYVSDNYIKDGKLDLNFSANIAHNPHRYPGHQAPGILLFNFEDNEGWFVFDPSVAPGKAVFYDDPPSIDKVNYTVNLRAPEWWYTKPEEGAPRLGLYTIYGDRGFNDLGKPFYYEPLGEASNSNTQGKNILKYVSHDSTYSFFSFSYTLDAVEDNHVKDFHFQFFKNDKNDKYNRYPLNGDSDYYYVFNNKEATVGWFDLNPDKYPAMPWTSTKPDWWLW